MAVSLPIETLGKATPLRSFISARSRTPPVGRVRGAARAPAGVTGLGAPAPAGPAGSAAEAEAVQRQAVARAHDRLGAAGQQSPVGPRRDRFRRGAGAD